MALARATTGTAAAAAKTRRRPKAWAAAGLALVLAAAGCATSSPGTPTAPPAPSTTPAAAATAAATPAQIPSPSLRVTPPPATPPPLAGSFPVVNSCDPASVPGAIPTPAPATPKAGFTLHVPILMYHRIVPKVEAGNSLAGLVVAPETFDAQLTGLVRAGWHTITMAALANDLQAGVTPPARTVAITIDDGWDDGFNYAFPILRSHGFVATYYVIAGRIDKPNFLSSAQLDQLVAAGDDIGDHTMDHVALTTQGAAALKYQIDAGESRIAQVTGRWPETLAYPSGREDGQVVAEAEACGELRIAAIDKELTVPQPGATQAGSNRAPVPTASIQSQETWAYRFTLPRMRVSPDTGPAALLEMLSR